jgi:hypothetical protein
MSWLPGGLRRAARPLQARPSDRGRESKAAIIFLSALPARYGESAPNRGGMAKAITWNRTTRARDLWV